MAPKAKYLTSRCITLLLLLLALGTTYLAYKPGLSGTFIFDDYPNIVNNPEMAVQDLHGDTLRRAGFSSSSGPLRRPVSMLSFAANYYASGFAPYYFKITNLIIHLGTGLGIFSFGVLLLNSYKKRFEPDLSGRQIQSISIAIAAVWLLHPLNLTAVLYVVQRMTSLSALFVIWGLVIFVWGRDRLLEGKTGAPAILVSLLIFTPLATLSKETGALMPLFMLVIEITVFNFQTKKIAARRFLIGLFGITVAIPALIFLIFIASHPAWLASSYQGRSFTLTERIMTEPRIIWFYVYEIVLPSLTQMGLFHDDIVNSHGLLTPATTLISILGIAALFALSWLTRRKAPLITFGILFFLLGHALESSVFALEITFEHRNYLPMLGILFPMFFYLLYPLKQIDNLPLRQFAALLFIALCAYDTWTRSSAWSNPFVLAENEVAHHPNSARNNGQMGNNYANITTADPKLNDVYYLQVRRYYEQSNISDPNYTTGLFALIITSATRDKDIDPSWINELEHRLKTASLQSDIGNQLVDLINCQMEQRCKLSQHDLDRLMKAPLENPAVVGGKRALVLSSLSFYFVDIANDYPAALDAMHQTVALAPQELEFRLTLIKFLIAYMRPDEAKRELSLLKRMDSLNAYTKQIATQEKLIAELENNQRH